MRVFPVACYGVTDWLSPFEKGGEGGFFWFPLEVGRLPPGLWADAGINRRALSEPFDETQGRLRELARPPSRRVRPI